MPQHQVDPARPRCSICVDGTGELLGADGRTFRYSAADRSTAASCSVRLCRACRAESGDWNARAMSLEDGDNLSEAPVGHSIAVLRDRKPRPAQSRAQQIRLLVTHSRMRVPVRPRGWLRSKKEWVWEWRPLTLADVARLMGCSRQAVQKALRKELERYVSRR